MTPMPDNSTWAGVIALNLSYHAYCDHCDRHAEIDMTKMPPEGNAIGRSFRCTTCNRLGSVVVSHRSTNRSYSNAKPDRS